MNESYVSFPWEWHPHVDVWLLLGGVTALYFIAIHYLGPKKADLGEPAATRGQKILFCIGMAFLWIGADWPMHDLSEDYLFSFHMLQHTLFSLVAPPLLLAGMPAWMIRLIIPKRAMGLLRFVTRPVVAFIVFNTALVVTHWPPVVNAALASEPLHFGIHVALVGASLIMWWPVVDPLPETKRLSEPAKMLYLFAQSILPTVPASFITFSSTPLYDSYARFPRLWGLSVVDDQRIAGLIMKLLGGLLLWSAIAFVFFRWSSKEEDETPEPMTWENFERELEAWEMRE
jgi:putative membrane protein